MRIIFLLITLLLITTVKSQTVFLTVKVNEPATVLLTDSTRKKMFIAADSMATFSVLPNRKYQLKVTASGYEDFSSIVLMTDSGTTLDVKLQPKNKNLQDVTVIARKPLIKQEDDKTVVDAEVLSQSSVNAFEVLERTPGAVVDQDGNVYLNSATPAMIQINGREVKLSAADLASLLKSLPANSVVKVEILRNPSSKYDAASTGGIVNIVLKKGIKLGTNGSANIGYFQGRYATQTLGFNLNKSRDKLQSYLSYQFTRRNNFESLISNRLISADTSAVNQAAYTNYPALNHYLSTGLSYEVSKKLIFGYDFRISFNESKSNASNQSALTKLNFITNADVSNTSSVNNGNIAYIGNNFTSRYKIDSSGSEWTTAVDLNFHRTVNHQQYIINRIAPFNFILNGAGDINNKKAFFNFQTDLTYKFKSGLTLETGFKWMRTSSFNNADYTIQTNNDPVKLDSFQTNHFKYNEVITSGYLQIAKKLGGLSIKPGVRIERTDINGNQVFPGESNLSIKRTDVFPYLFVRQQIAKIFGFKVSGNLIFRRSISRPYYEALNPFPRFVDPYLFEVGNPALKPQFTTNYEFNVAADEYPILTVGLNDTKNIFTAVTYQDDISKIAYRTFDNLGKNKEFYIRFMGGIPPGKKYFFYAGGQHNLNQFKGYYQNQPFEYTRGSWMFFMYQNYKPTDKWNISLHGFMRLRGFQNFYELKTFGALHLSINRSIMKKKANIIVSLSDPFRTNQVRFALNQPGIAAFGSRINDTRRISLTFRFNFGMKPKEEKKNMFEAGAESN